MRPHALLGLALTLGLSGCVETVCCNLGLVGDVGADLDDRRGTRVTRRQCAARGGTPVEAGQCGEDTLDDDLFEGCETFCAEVAAACPEDGDCFDACILNPAPPPPAAIQCADLAGSCAGVDACWTWYTGSPR